MQEDVHTDFSCWSYPMFVSVYPDHFHFTPLVLNLTVHKLSPFNKQVTASWTFLKVKCITFALYFSPFFTLRSVYYWRDTDFFPDYTSCFSTHTHTHTHTKFPSCLWMQAFMHMPQVAFTDCSSVTRCTTTSRQRRTQLFCLWENAWVTPHWWDIDMEGEGSPTVLRLALFYYRWLPYSNLDALSSSSRCDQHGWA